MDFRLITFICNFSEITVKIKPVIIALMSALVNQVRFNFLRPACILTISNNIDYR